MKRSILIGSLAFSIIGMISLATMANIKTNKLLKMNIEYLVGSQADLGEVKVEHEIRKGRYLEKKIQIDKNGIKDKAVKIETYDSNVKDKELFRGIEFGGFDENKEFRATVSMDEKKGVVVRYINNASGKYKEFNIIDKTIVPERCSVSNAFIYEEDIYAIYRNKESENFLIRINLPTEKLVDIINMKTEQSMYFIQRKVSDKGYTFKDNKLFIPTTDIDDNIRVYCYDLSNKNLTYKDINMNDKKMYSSHDSYINDKIYLFKVLEDNEFEIAYYDIIEDVKKSVSFKITGDEKLKDMFSSDIKETDDSFYICGQNYLGDDKVDGYIMRVDKNNGELKYFAKLKDYLLFDYRLKFQ